MERLLEDGWIAGGKLREALSMRLLSWTAVSEGNLHTIIINEHGRIILYVAQIT